VLRSLLDALTLDAPVTAVGVDLEALGPPQLVQGTLFDGVQAGGRERVRETLAEVDRRYKGRLRRVVPSETPHSLFEDRRLLLLPYDPGEPPATAPAGDAEPAVRARPVRLHRQRGRCYLAARGWRDEIVAVHNQWEADDWWPEAARRTYYRVRTRGGLVATLAVDHTQGRWLLVERVD
jgi:hypothetical protein